MGKVLFFDVDGTLLDFDGKMPESASKGLKRAQENGHQIVICSGRSLYQSPQWLLDKADGLVGSTGSYVRCQGKVVYEHFMPMGTIVRVKKVMDCAGGMISGQAEEGLFLNQATYDRTLERMKKFLKGDFERDFKPGLIARVNIVENLEEFRGIKKLLFNDSTWSVEHLREELGDICDITESSFSKEDHGSGEITCKGINKALGMQKYIDALGASREDTIAFGDGPNDFEMLDFAAIGVAMGNAREALKTHADVITTDLQDNGIYNALVTLGLI